MVHQYPTHRVVFSGISHGAALAQAAALRFALAGTPGDGWHHRLWVASWNSYKWTDMDGSQRVYELFEDRFLSMVLSDRSDIGRRGDSVPGFPPGLAPMPGTVLLDVNQGKFYPCESLPDSHLDFGFLWRMVDLHFAKTANRAVKQAMATALDEDPVATQHLTGSLRLARGEDLSDIEVLDRGRLTSKSAGSLESSRPCEEVARVTAPEQAEDSLRSAGVTATGIELTPDGDGSDDSDADSQPEARALDTAETIASKRS